MTAAQKRLDSLKRLLADLHERLKLDFGFALWDDSRVPANYPKDALAISIADEGAIAGIVRKPNFDTLLNLWISARVDIKNGTVFDMVERRPKVRTREIPKKVSWWLALDVARRFLFVPRGGPWPLEAIPDHKPATGDAAENKENIRFHYDVSNKFYDTFLDPERGYTCGYFHDWEKDSDQATIQKNKFDHVCRKLRLKPGEHMLDIGCGWAGLLTHAVQNYGVTGHGVTLSEDQFAWTQDKLKRLGLSDKITIELRDYASLEGKERFDKISQCEMFEHIGLEAHPKYFTTVHRLLKPNGFYLHQASVRVAKRDAKTFLKKRPEVLALTKYIFPGAEFDHIGMLLTNFERFGFEVHDVEDWREHHARTCRIWYDDLYKNQEAAIREGGLVTTRMWLTWMAGCSIAFDRGGALVYQTLVSKRRRGPSGLPPTRADLYR
ncbi:MAG TPA: cyclopropane-fatty-acyl-phospholipid synthase family protein [Xanthobacteraceae bacterium]|jgi:cyclopropane-fatty-acyl-phospholipid synthase